jgi:nitrite reductase (NO-forming)/hydroxylamine reductase
LLVAAALSLSACKKKEEAPVPSPTTAATAGTGDLASLADHPGASVFQTQCVACHTIGGGKLIGPDLHGVTELRERDWLVRWIDDPVGMAQSDPIGQQILAEWGTQMPRMPISREQIDDIIDYMAQATATVPVYANGGDQAPIELTEAELDESKTIFFNRCAGCHGTLRAGATGPTLEPTRTTEIGTAGIEAILHNGTAGGMPAWGRLGILDDREINMVARFLQLPVPEPPQRPIEDIRESWNLAIPVAERPSEPQHDRDWENFFGVILRDAGKVAIFDGDTHELINVLHTGFAVHILRSSSSGRYFYAVGRDGRVTMIDLWTPEPTITAQVQGCFDARSVDGSKFEGYEDRYVIQGCYWPPQYVVYDGQTLEPLQVTSVVSPAIDGTELSEVRVAAMVASHYAPVWVIALKESGYVGIVDYSQEGFPMVSKIAAARFLHDGGFDHTGRYFMVAANMSDRMSVIDVQEQTLVTNIEVPTLPHPGRGANWEDPEYGWVNATTHIGSNKLTIYGADPEGSPEHAWQVVRSLDIPTVGSLFVKTHPNSNHVWFDSPLSNEDALTRQICVYNQTTATIDRCWQPFETGRAVHFEYNREGTEVWVSGWDPNGQLVVYNDATLEEVTRISGDWLVTPTGKFNVFNTSNDIY